MRPSSRFCVPGLAVSLALVTASSPAVAAPNRITGKLSKPGYTVIALAADGTAKSVRTRQGAFRLVPPAERVTLHLRAANGKYGGPIVVGGRGRRVIVGVNAGARLGRIGVREGYARVSRAPRRRWVDRRRTARAKRGVPIGAGVFGRVRSRNARGPAADRDRDGIPDPLDIDDDGDLILDHFDRRASARAAQAEQPGFQIQTSLGADLHQTVNANPRDALGAPTFTDAQIEAAFPSLGRLDLEVLSSSPELDCGRPQSRRDPLLGGLVYCSSGGTGRVLQSGAAPDDCPASPSDCPPFPGPRGGEFDPDGDGFGTLTATERSPEGAPFAFFAPGATTDQIGTGDLLIQCVPGCPAPRGSEFPATLGYAFATVPALRSFSDGQGDPVTVPYPVTGHPGPGCGPPQDCSGPDPGVRGNGFPVRAGPNGDVVLTLTFWRPQRKPIAGEHCLSDTPPCAWIDIGRLNHTAGIADAGLRCEQNAFSEDDPNLTPPSSPFPGFTGGGLIDTADDQPASPANTFAYTLNVTRCLESHGRTFNPGQERGFSFEGNVGDDAAQQAFFMRQ